MAYQYQKSRSGLLLSGLTRNRNPVALQYPPPPKGKRASLGNSLQDANLEQLNATQHREAVLFESQQLPINFQSGYSSGANYQGGYSSGANSNTQGQENQSTLPSTTQGQGVLTTQSFTGDANGQKGWQAPAAKPECSTVSLSRTISSNTSLESFYNINPLVDNWTCPAQAIGEKQGYQSLNKEKIPSRCKDAGAASSSQSTSQLTHDHRDLEWEAVPQTLNLTSYTQAQSKEYSEGSEGLGKASILEVGLEDVHTSSSEVSRKSLEQQIVEIELGSNRSRSSSSVEDADSSSQSSSQECRSLMSMAKRLLLTELMDIFHLNYDRMLGNRLRAYAHPSGNEKTADSTTSSGLGSVSLRPSSKVNSGLPQFPFPEQDDGDGNMKNPDLPAQSKPCAKAKRRYACIFYKHDPITYGTNGLTGAKYRACGGPGFESVSRVKEHLYRRHRAPTQCPRCCVEFKTYGELGVHLNQTVRCEQQLSQQVEGITVQQYEKLKSKKRACSDQTEEDRWREAYRICFPEEIVPTPYYDWDILNAEIPMVRDIEDLQEYSRQCVPRIVESRLEAIILEKLQPVRDEIIGALGEIVESSISAVFEEWQQKRQRRSFSPDIGGQDSTLQNRLSTHIEPLAEIQGQPSDNFDEFLEMPQPSFDRSGEFSLGETSSSLDVFGDHGLSNIGYASQEQYQPAAPSDVAESTVGQSYGAQDVTVTQGNHTLLEQWTGSETGLDPSQLNLDTAAFPSWIPENNSLSDYSNPFAWPPNDPCVTTSNKRSRLRRQPQRM